MIKKETYIFTSIITALVVLAFSLIYFLVPFPIKDYACHIVNYVVTIIAAITFIIFFLLGMKKKNGVMELVLRLPLIKFTIVLETLNLAFCVIQAVTNAFVLVPFYVPLLVAIFELIIFFILFITKKQNIKHIEKNDDIKKESIHTIKELRTKSMTILSLCNDDVSKENVSLVVEKLKFSDPVSNDKTKEIETKIDESLSKLQEEVNEGKKINSVEEIITLIENRNVQCLGSK